MSEEMVRAIRDDDPFASWPVDQPVPIKPIGFESIEGAKRQVSTVDNWGYFEGALLTVGLQRSTEEGLRLEGSAIMIAPGLAVTATHVFKEDPADYQALEAGEQRMGLLGLRSNGSADFWNVQHILHAKHDDMALLSLRLNSRIDADWFISTLQLTTRTPVSGEQVSIVGSREMKEFRRVAMGDTVSQTNAGDVYVAQGEVGEIYESRRDAAMPFPTFEVQCGSLGGMSGGAVFDDSGRVLGVISRGFATATGAGPTFATRITELLTRDPLLTWPPGAQEKRVPLHKLSGDILDLEGRDRLQMIDGELAYEVWQDRD